MTRVDQSEPHAVVRIIFNTAVGNVKFIATCGMCFCPLCYSGCVFGSNVNRDMQQSPLVQQLAAQGVRMEFVPGNKFTPHEMYFSMPPSVLQQQVQRPQEAQWPGAA